MWREMQSMDDEDAPWHTVKDYNSRLNSYKDFLGRGQEKGMMKGKGKDKGSGVDESATALLRAGVVAGQDWFVEGDEASDTTDSSASG